MMSEHLTDRIPEVLHGRDAWTDADRGHLASCADCAAEWRLVSEFPLSEPGPAIDVEALAHRVMEQVRSEPAVLPLQHRHAWRRALIGLAAAASVALVFFVWRAQPAAEVSVVPTHEPTMLPELDQLLEAELEVVLAYVTPASDEPLGVVPRLGDLSDEELELLLAEVEG
jgi:hypothetical protein